MRLGLPWKGGSGIGCQVLCCHGMVNQGLAFLHPDVEANHGVVLGKILDNKSDLWIHRFEAIRDRSLPGRQFLSGNKIPTVELMRKPRYAVCRVGPREFSVVRPISKDRPPSDTKT